MVVIHGGKMFGYIVKLIQLLNANSKPSQIANSVCIGMLLGFIPKNNALWYILMFFFAFVRINKGCYLIFILIGSALTPLLDPLFDDLGYAILTIPSLAGFYGWLLDIPFVAFTRFNYSIVMGSMVFGLLLYAPLFAGIIYGIKAWRKYISPKFIDSKILKTIYRIPGIAKLHEQVTKYI
ncbi:MAG: TIGR03546 family protein [Treponema sp.]|nr:TIGR03546 family protein [Treponema sp.]